jgi:predicted RNase H-like HicB family nuclease
MERPNYRVLLSYDSERKVFTARIPELPPCVGEGANRGEALANMERELDALLGNLSEQGGRLPPAIDELPSSGEITVKISRSLHRDLAFAAQVEDIELSQLASELLASGLEHRQRSGRPQRRPQGSGPREAHGNTNTASEEPPRRHDRPDARPDFRGDRGEHDGRWRGGDRNTAARFHGLLEDRASFMEYVRGLEADGGHGRNPRGSYGHGGPGGQGGQGGHFGDRGGGRRPPGGPPRGDRPPPRDRRPGPGGGGGGGGGPEGGGGAGGGGGGQ